MAEIDLIPASWRAERRTRRALRRGAAALAGAVLAVAAGRIGIELAIRQERAAQQLVQGQQRDGERAAARLTAREAQLDEARQQQARIAALKGEGMVARVLLPLDAALGDDILFDELGYARQITLPQPGNPTPPPAETTLTIRGKAPDAAAIGQFADALGKTGPCAKPRLTPGNVKRYTRFELLEFSLTCPLRPTGGGA